MFCIGDWVLEYSLDLGDRLDLFSVIMERLLTAKSSSKL